MKKIVLIVVSLFLVFTFSTSVFAQSNKQKEAKDNPGKAVGQQQAGELGEEDGDETETEEEDLSSSEAAKSRNAIRKLERVMDRVSNPEIGEQIQETVQEQEQIEERTEKSLDQIDKRPSFVKFLIGPSFKNLGQLRKEVVQTRNNIKKLEQIKEKTPKGIIQDDVETAIAELSGRASDLQETIYSELEGFSLFGWLFRWLNGFDLPEEPVVLLEPTVTPEASPELSPEPSEEPVATETPLVTEEPIVPTVTPEVAE